MEKLSYTIENFNFLVEENRRLSEAIARLNHTLELFKKALFGPRSERIIDQSDCQIPDLPGFEMPEQQEQPGKEPSVTVPEHQRRKIRNKGEFTLELPDDLPCEEEIIDIPEEKKFDPETGEPLVVIGMDVSKKLAYRSGGYLLKVIKRLKYGHKNAPLSGIIQEPAPPCIIESSKFDPSFLAHIVVEKYAYHMPLNRQLEKLAMSGIRISSQQMSSLIINLGEKVMPLVEAMERQIFQQGVIFTDDTPVKVAENGRRCRQAYMWIYHAGKPNAPPYHLYKFSSGRSHRFPRQHLQKFKGYIHADAFKPYEELDADPDSGISWAACWSHARRKFFELGSESTLGAKVLRLMRALFRYEKIAWRRSPAERLAIRQEQELPLVDRLFSFLKEQVRLSTILPKSKAAEAIGYMLTREKNFRLYLGNPDLCMHNNASERALRKVVVGRNNWLFVGSDRSGRAAANLLSLVQSCRAMGIDPQEYLQDIFTRLLEHPARRINELLPDQWRKRKESQS